MASLVADMPPELIASLQYQQEHIDEDRTGTLVGVTWSLWTLAVVAVVLRFYAERMMRSPFRYHDMLILLGLVWRGPMWMCCLKLMALAVLYNRSLCQCDHR